MVSICTGSFALAAAGVLDGLRATTHWQYVDEFDRAFPAVSVDRDVLWPAPPTRRSPRSRGIWA
ncbi:DJ-1/PfpI family protein [Streptomyces malaysiensis]|uniref:DJ-1/PfpI family protein n=1 Tax=Streptomyces malaysiensis TaxID=92644 RepID=UPI003710C5E5